ncbi:MAG: hypothetical protein RDU20_19920, partial [Desulfomonilaceae bacterium]|nr:hypothetical protein [Desulfomonilaceae bacterium]
QDDEMVFSLPGSGLPGLVRGLKEAGKKLGARYPITFYQNFEPQFPKIYREVGEEVGAFRGSVGSGAPGDPNGSV